jgi:hypothetical protein
MKRRNFIRSGSVAAAGLLLGRSAMAGLLAAPRISHSIGLQLYTLGDLMITDSKGSLE